MNLNEEIKELQRKKFIQDFCLVVGACLWLGPTTSSSKFNCPIWPDVDKYFVPFTDNEVQEFITNRNCPIKEYRERTTLPLIVKDVLIARKPYDAALDDLYAQMKYGSSIHIFKYQGVKYDY